MLKFRTEFDQKDLWNIVCYPATKELKMVESFNILNHVSDIIRFVF